MCERGQNELCSSFRRCGRAACLNEKGRAEGDQQGLQKREWVAKQRSRGTKNREDLANLKVQ